MIHVYTDGSCNNKSKQAGGCGIVLKYGEFEKHVSLGQFSNTTSARMEIRGALEALRLITNKNIPVMLYCDNKYVVNAIAMKWAERWESEYWLVNGANRVNYDLWIQVLKEIRKFTKSVEFVWIKGHNGNHYNEICDRLAALGGKSLDITDDSVILID